MDPVVRAFTGILWLIPVLFVVAALRLLFAAKLRGMVGEMFVAFLLNRLGQEAMHDIIIPNGQGGWTQIDHLVLLPAGLLVVETKNYSGIIFGRERERKWTQRLGGQSFQLMNPLHQNYGHVEAAKALVPGVPVHGLVVFAGSARFPKGTPSGVTSPRNLHSAIAPLCQETGNSDKLTVAWDEFKKSVRTDKAARREHLAYLRSKHGRDLRTRIAHGMLIAAAVIALVLSV